MSGSRAEPGSGASERPSPDKAANLKPASEDFGSEPAFAPSRLAAFTVLLGALIVFLSQVVAAYVVKDDLGETVATVNLVDKHGFIPIILAVVAVVALIYAVRSGNRLGALLIVVVGLTVIFVFFIVDLPDVGSQGLYNAPTAGNLNAKGSGSTGLWLELIGGVILVFSGFALSTLDPEGLQAIGPSKKNRKPPKRPAATAEESR